MNPDVIRTAKAIRKEVQSWAVKLEDDYAINPDTLRGACGIGSYLLHQALEAQGIASVFAMGRFYPNGYSHRGWWEVEGDSRCNHCWLEIDGLIVDITATQFGEEEEIYLTEMNDDRYWVIHEGQPAVDNLMRAWDDQSPSSYPSSMPRILNQALQEISQ